MTSQIGNSRTGNPAAIRLVALGLTLIGTLSLAACGGSPSAVPTQPGESAPARNPSAADDLAKIFSCLKAAGIAVPDLPSGMPSGRPTGRPSGVPNDPRPTGMPSGAPSEFAGRRSIDFNDPPVSAALKACGAEPPKRHAYPTGVQLSRRRPEWAMTTP